VITVVVCTYNRSVILTRMLESFFAQTCLDRVAHELILVDNNSSDDTRSVVDGFARFPTLRYVFEPRQGLSGARNRGLAEARGDIVAFLDDDVIVDANWLAGLRACFDATGAHVVGGRSYLIFEADPPPWLGPHFRKYLSEVDLGPKRQICDSGHRLFGLNLAFRKAALLDAGGFDEALGRRGSNLLGGEEIATVSRILSAGGLVLYEPDAVVGHIIQADRLEWRYFRRVFLGAGRSTAMRDPSAGTWRRVWRIADALWVLGWALAKTARAAITGAAADERQAAKSRLLWAAGFLAERWRRLWHADGA